MRLSDEAMRQVRGGDIGMVFQEPMTSLNPVLTIGRQITEASSSTRADGPRHSAAPPSCWGWSASPSRAPP